MSEKLPGIDPFKPADPKIPGVVREGGPLPVPPEPTKSTPRPAWPVWSALGVIVVGVALGGWFMKSQRGSQSAATSADEPAAGAPLPAAAQAPPPLPTAPGEVATTENLARPWSFQRFNFQDSATGETVPAMVVHLSSGGYWAFSLNEPFGKCTLQFVTDVESLRSEYAYPQADHPMVVSPCSHTVYDLLRYGVAPRGLVRGEVMAGTGIRPPIAIEVHVEGHRVLATRME